MFWCSLKTNLGFVRVRLLVALLSSPMEENLGTSRPPPPTYCKKKKRKKKNIYIYIYIEREREREEREREREREIERERLLLFPRHKLLMVWK
jgi:hypothetical protein